MDQVSRHSFELELNEYLLEKLFAENGMSRALRSNFLLKQRVSLAAALIGYVFKISKDRFSIVFQCYIILHPVNKEDFSIVQNC